MAIRDILLFFVLVLTASGSDSSGSGGFRYLAVIPLAILFAGVVCFYKYVYQRRILRRQAVQQQLQVMTGQVHVPTQQAVVHHPPPPPQPRYGGPPPTGYAPPPSQEGYAPPPPQGGYVPPLPEGYAPPPYSQVVAAPYPEQGELSKAPVERRTIVDDSLRTHFLYFLPNNHQLS